LAGSRRWRARPAPGAVAGSRIENVLAGGAKISGPSLEDERKDALSVQSIKRFVDPGDIAALAVFIASDAGNSISGQMLSIDNDMQSTSFFSPGPKQQR
jgi:NAD(P)-dependent dehydrogenase (short-subunit alcohol dehydrogenase family)